MSCPALGVPKEGDCRTPELGFAILGVFMEPAMLLCPYQAHPPAERPLAWVARGANTLYQPISWVSSPSAAPGMTRAPFLCSQDTPADTSPWAQSEPQALAGDSLSPWFVPQVHE